MKCHWNGQGFIEKMLQQIKTQLKQTQITPIRPMDNGYPLVFLGNCTQIDDPNVSQTSGYQQTGNTLWVRDMALLQMKATTFLVRKEGFNPEALPIPVTRFLSQVHKVFFLNLKVFYLNPKRIALAFTLTNQHSQTCNFLVKKKGATRWKRIG